MTITKWAALKAGWPATIKDTLTVIWFILPFVIVLAALSAIILGIPWGAYVPPKTVPHWFTWAARLYVIAWVTDIFYSTVALIVNNAIAVGREKLRTSPQRGQEGRL